MRRPTFDLDVLRTFVTGVEFNSFAKAAERLGRSTSAVSAQLKKLEDQVGSAVLAKSGRGLALTPLGEALLSHARRLLELNDEIFESLHETQVEGCVRLGLQEDFGEHLLSEILRRFAKAHPRVSLEVRIGRNAELLGLIERGQLDLALAWETAADTPYSSRIGMTPMQWIGPKDLSLPTDQGGAPLPLVMFDAPCVLRSAATQALDQARIPWRVALTSPSVGGIWAAVAAGLGITLRTRIGLPAHLAVLPGLPDVPSLGYVLHRAVEEPTGAVRQLAAAIRTSLEEQVFHDLAQPEKPPL
ncbi:LysR substrate-binding domain-containing protein [Pseudomonas gingeri]|uniref:LysR family transcriptional regulator n=1 Tax=Pseudomonas gingeri TaxID=117681 RepID=A0A7Y7YCX6_9PSED|nr:LysR substrate-binding domain-containing protein [Pseudomonas gingeri]NVZ99437.1 LysR family transcriptional regulator [Pseudomonas gingeri]NWA13482.1 LysR family transcriptional regulator [Pseudomonas gingeri]NWA55743.1 LysR family transcriptional regulator [Pseudomonas gingeri]NWA95403.1 LysR family transcriptional regulator [Pseudomonas gingeri]NWB00490.1 LysR family transcriptional regulator [Pseudomonas gingeri]